MEAAVGLKTVLGVSALLGFVVPILAMIFAFDFVFAVAVNTYIADLYAYFLRDVNVWFGFVSWNSFAAVELTSALSTVPLFMIVGTVLWLALRRRAGAAGRLGI